MTKILPEASKITKMSNEMTKISKTPLENN